MSASLKDIAEALSLSKTTVSWVLSGKSKRYAISEQTRQRVIDCATEMGYPATKIARTFNTGATNRIGFIVDDIENEFYREVLRGVENEAKGYGYSVLTCGSGDILSLLDITEGIIIAPTRDMLPSIDTISKEQLPVVFFENYLKHDDSSYVITNNQQVGCELVGELIKRGSQKIAIITSPTHSNYYKGYIRAHNQAGVEPIESLCISLEKGMQKVELTASLDRMLREEPDVDAIFFAMHSAMIDCISYFADRDINIDRRFNLASIYTTVALSLLVPNMIYAKPPTREIGRRAIQILVGLIDSKIKGNDMSLANKKVVLQSHIKR